jgi:two-component system, LytTR family, response regulator
MPIKCIAIDDEPPALLLLQEYIAAIPSLQLIKTFDDAIAGAVFLRSNPVDLLFIDINMPDMTGLELVRSLEDRPMIIFTTAHKKFAIDGFDLDAIDYLLKPISNERFAKAVAKATEYFAYKSKNEPDEAESLFVYSEYRMVKIPVSDIEYIESLEDYIRIHIINSKPVMTLMTMKKVLEKLPASKFRRIHRSYIVATGKVRSILNRKAKLESSAELPISDSYLGFITDWKKV